MWPKLKAQLRGPLLRSKLMAVKGTWQRDGDVRNLIAGHVEDLTALLGEGWHGSRDFHQSRSWNADMPQQLRTSRSNRPRSTVIWSG